MLSLDVLRKGILYSEINGFMLLSQSLPLLLIYKAWLRPKPKLTNMTCNVP